MRTYTNRLANESSPYLLQHAHNPVDWYPWGEEALQRAITENRPILVSIGYAACHWCHVMEKESFENPQTADLMNSEFICIKIDREERPDLDLIYMDALQAMTGSGGWPLNIFLTPDAKPFYGGTYFPPKRLYNRPSWTEVLKSVAQAFREKPLDIYSQSENLTRHIVQSGNFGQSGSIPGNDDYSLIFNKGNLQLMTENILRMADKEDGGFGNAPKFPSTFSIRYLLHYYYHTKSKEALHHACLSLDKMIAGGIYDQIGGGFARYSTDKNWLVPHFEKMLYDNALLVIVLSEAYQITQKALYRNTIQDTLAFIERELLSPEEGFYAALDADSEGEEGKYYVWSKKEIEDVLQEDAKWFLAFYDISEEGNWEGVNIPRILLGLDDFAGERNIQVEELKAILERSRNKLLTVRQRRIPPLRDDKILLGWNALMNQAYSKAFAALGIDSYRKKAIQNMSFIQREMRGEGLYYYYHGWKEGNPKNPGFLDDYANMVAALLLLQEITGDTSYLFHAKEITEFVITNFGEESSGLFFYTHVSQRDLIIRKKEIYDGAICSGNSVMAQNLHYLGIIFDKPQWKQRSEQMIKGIYATIIKYPNSFGYWANLLQAITFGIPELVITGENIEGTVKEFLANFIPAKVFQSTTQENNIFPLLAGKRIRNEQFIYLCKDYACQTPETELKLILCRLEELHKI